MSNEKRVPGCLGYIGDHTTQLRWDYFINHEIRIPINQPTILESTAMSFSWLNWVFCSLTGGVGPYLMAHRLRRNPSRQRFLCKSMAPSAMDAIATSRAGMLLSLLPVPEKLGFEVVFFFLPRHSMYSISTRKGLRSPSNHTARSRFFCSVSLCIFPWCGV